MPCNSDYLEPTWSEIEASKLWAVYEEVITGKDIVPSEFGNGYHKGDYARISDNERDEIVKAICKSLSNSDIHTYSLETQMWWREHKKADKERSEKESLEKVRERNRDIALSKLTDDEKESLGL